MEKADCQKPAMEAARRNAIEGDWSASELDDAASSRSAAVARGSTGMSDEQLRSAGVLFAIIILGFAAFGVSLSQLVPGTHDVAFLNCVHVAGNAARLSCFDRAALNAAAPFKGGSPFSTHSQSDLADAG